jgi:putative two-component system response regulator
MKRHAALGREIFEVMTASEEVEVRRHTRIGERILGDPYFNVLRLARVIAQTHHEKFDGSGYPMGLAGADIPLPGRIVAVADVYDALSSKRPYKDPIPREKCFAILEEGRGAHFDPQVLDAFFTRSADIVQAQLDLADPA